MIYFRPVLGVFLIIAWCFVFLASSAAQVTSPGLPKSVVEPKGFTWTETFEGSGNTDGFITDINSTVGYIFNAHFAVDFGIPYPRDRLVHRLFMVFARSLKCHETATDAGNCQETENRFKNGFSFVAWVAR